MTDWKALCEELLGLWDAQPLPPYESSWASVIARIRGALLAQPEHEVASPTQDELWELWLRLDRELPDRPAAVAAFWEHAQVEARARWGRPAPAPAGEVGEPPAELVQQWYDAARGPRCEQELATQAARWGAAQVAERQAAPVPVASDVYFEFVVSDADCCTQAGGIAPTYAQALSEGQHYLAQYQQDGPHTLEVRRVEVLHPDALPLPSGEAQP